MLVGFSAVLPVQLVAPGPASPDPTSYGLGPGGSIRIASGPAGRGRIPASVSDGGVKSLRPTCLQSGCTRNGARRRRADNSS